ncbi:MAG: hypothetical protein GF421_11915 [Candidatus Aminicenantes bacterium]|nr:hypothetical protein [Candidatus Aminicenantes bacterium]
MTNNKSIEITPNVQKCLKILSEAVKGLPSGKLKTDAEGAVNYLDRTFQGEPQPGGGENCPEGSLIIKT